MNTSDNLIPKKLAVINDLSGFGRCSLTVMLPVISAMGVQCCPLPTSILSNHSGFPTWTMDDYTDKMEPYMDAWAKLSLRFDGIATGFLASERQIALVNRFLSMFRTEQTLVIVDPVMGDSGKAYSSCTPEVCSQMRNLLPQADLITPNLTEACLLTKTPYTEDGWTREKLSSLAVSLTEMGPKKVVITGINHGNSIANLCLEYGKEPVFINSRKVGQGRPGTGDIFTAILAADLVNGTPLHLSVRKAASFVRRCIQKSEELQMPTAEGVCFERLIHSLH